MSERCIACRSGDVYPFLEIKRVPVFCNVLSTSHDSAISMPRGDIKLASCQECGHISNIDFNPAVMDYHQDYENPLHYSTEFNQFATRVASDLVERFGLRGVSILDIGCGDGAFLKLICNLGGSRGLGFDPRNFNESGNNLLKEREGNIQIIRDEFSEKYSHIQADFVICRHVLEHLNDPSKILHRIYNALGDKRKAGAYFEVPNMEFTIEQLAIWDILYEHCSYFSRTSLSSLTASCGFKNQSLQLGFGDQFICLDVTRESSNKNIVLEKEEDQLRKLKEFAQSYNIKVERWRQSIETLHSTGARIVVWGAGSKGVSFLNAITSESAIKYVVDINPRKQGNFIAGTGQKIVPPDFLKEYRPENLILMNPIYKNEVVELIKRLEISPEIIDA
jgi:SAM-dependent methyltransferase